MCVAEYLVAEQSHEISKAFNCLKMLEKLVFFI